MKSHLFRTEALDAQRTRWLGEVRLSTPLSQVVWVSVSALFGFALLSFLILTSYARRERVSGILLPAGGLIDISAWSDGSVKQLFGAVGQEVRAGALLATVSGERSSKLGESSRNIMSELIQQRSRLDASIESEKLSLAAQCEDLKRQIGLLRAELAQDDRMSGIDSAALNNEQELLGRMRQLSGDGYISKLQITQQENEVLQAQGQVAAIAKARLQTARDLASSEGQLRLLPYTSSEKIDDLYKQLAQIEQEMQQNEVSRLSELKAPEGGVIAAVLVSPGQAVAPGQALVRIEPTDRPLEAVLLVPSTAIGFVRIGGDVVLHYAAFPYQKFGSFAAKITAVSRTPLTTVEAERLTGKAESEPVFKVVATLQDGFVKVNGKSYPLRSGMEFTADLLLERRSAFEWLFEPVYGLNGAKDGSS